MKKRKVDFFSSTKILSMKYVSTDSGLCVGKCDSLPNTECKIVKTNSNGYKCPCIAGFELDNAGKCIEETVSVNTVRVTTDQVTNQDTTKPTTVQADVTFPTEQNKWEKSTPNSGSVLTSIAGILVFALFLELQR